MAGNVQLLLLSLYLILVLVCFPLWPCWLVGIQLLQPSMAMSKVKKKSQALV